jgi:hypothetical protein
MVSRSGWCAKDRPNPQDRSEVDGILEKKLSWRNQESILQ